MKNEERKKILENHFDKLKDDYFDLITQNEDEYTSSNLELIADSIIIPMFKLDREQAINMWLYMLKKYSGICPNMCYSDIAGHISEKIGPIETYAVLKKRTFFRIYLYSEGQYSLDVDPIYYALSVSDFDLADELTDLLSKNDKCYCSSQEMLYELLFHLNTNSILSDKVNEGIIIFATKWSKQLVKIQKRKKIDLIIDDMRFKNDCEEDMDDNNHEFGADSIEPEEESSIEKDTNGLKITKNEAKGFEQIPLPFQKYIDEKGIPYKSYLGLYKYEGETYIGCSEAATCDKKTCNGCDILTINFNRLLLYERMAFSTENDKPTTDDEVYTAVIK